ncbi:hypothetical protein VTJ04DRAFT_9019 [Mycothermus thermophilus]|uniref:uncharacterized protein n=1 Tax=Humicola insolens TaxID=85995 RepID=UPI00374368DB
MRYRSKKIQPAASRHQDRSSPTKSNDQLQAIFRPSSRHQNPIHSPDTNDQPSNQNERRDSRTRKIGIFHPRHPSIAQRNTTKRNKRMNKRSTEKEKHPDDQHLHIQAQR